MNYECSTVAVAVVVVVMVVMLQRFESVSSTPCWERRRATSDGTDAVSMMENNSRGVVSPLV